MRSPLDRRDALAAAWTTLLLAGCQHLPTEEPPIRVLYRSSQCGPAPEFSVSWLADQASLDRAWRRLSAQRLDSTPPPALTAAGHGALLIHQGEQPSAGYGVALAAERLQRDGDAAQATLVVQLTQPAPGTLNAALITSPCLLLEIAPGGYQRLQVNDQSGQTLARVPLRGDAATPSANKSNGRRY